MSSNLPNVDPRIRHGYAQVGDVRLHYAESGERDRPLVLLLHGFPEFWYSWRHQLAALGERFHAVAPDLRGYNLSDKPDKVEDYRIGKLMDDVTGLIRHFGARRAGVVGHDWGAAIAWALAEFFPDYVSKLSALQVPPGAVWAANMTWRQALASWYMLFFQLPRLPEWRIGAKDFAGLERMFKTTARGGTFTDSDIALYKEMLKRRSVSGETSALTGGVNYYRANFSLLSRNLTSVSRRGKRPRARVRVPTLFVYGERDAFVMPETVRDVGSYVDAPFREVRLARAGHWVQQEYPNEVSAALLGFLSE
jgi:pimeloyl-ACP methyl ester carboxylesterase